MQTTITIHAVQTTCVTHESRRRYTIHAVQTTVQTMNFGVSHGSLLESFIRNVLDSILSWSPAVQDLAQLLVDHIDKSGMVFGHRWRPLGQVSGSRVPNCLTIGVRN